MTRNRKAMSARAFGALSFHSHASDERRPKEIEMPTESQHEAVESQLQADERDRSQIVAAYRATFGTEPPADFDVEAAARELADRDRATELFALFDAFAVARPWSLSLTNARGEAEALKAWARARGHAITEQHYIAGHRAPYADLKVRLDRDGVCDITVLGYRSLTEDEIRATEPEVRERTTVDRVGHREVAL